jgi:cell division protein FtsQ
MVMRLLPNRLRVSIVERTPVAFVRQGSQIGLVDASGVLLDMLPHGQGDAHYSFPVVTGIAAGDPASTRAARMKIFEQFTSDLDSSGEKISEKLSEVDLSNPEDVKALIPDNGKDVLVHFGDTDYLNRYRKFEEHLPEWRTQYPALSSVDMRYERQVVLEMQPGAAGASGSTASVSTEPGAAAPAADASAATPTEAVAKPVAKAVVKPHAKTHAKVVKKGPVSKWKPAKKAKPHRVAAKAHSRVVRRATGSSRYHSSQAVHP